MDGLAAGRTARGIAEDVRGAEAGAGEWSADGWMRSQVRRRIRNARALSEGGWREHVPLRAAGE